MKKQKIKPKRDKRIPERATENQVKLLTTLVGFQDTDSQAKKASGLC